MTDVTIIVATYNRPELLAEELASINVARCRTSATVRVLVVDDASDTDAAKGIAEEHGADYRRREVNGGVGPTLAEGFAHSRSTFVSFWGDDDIMLPDWFTLNLAAIEGFDVVANSYNRVGPNLEFQRTKILRPVTFADLKANIVSVNDGALVRRAVIDELRPERERAMMFTLWLALAAKGARFTVITEPTVLYRRHPGQLSGTPNERFMELRRQAIAEYA